MSLAGDDALDPALYDDTHGSAGRTGGARPRSLLWYIGRGVAFGLLGLAVLVAVLVLVVPAVAGAPRYATVAGPVQTAIPAGSLAVVLPQPVDGIGTGDVVAFSTDGGEVATGRVAGRTVRADGGTAFALVGAAAPVSAEEVRGVVWYTIPGAGWVDAALSAAVHGWVLPVIGVVLFGYAGWICLRAFLDRRRRGARDGATEV